MAAPAWDIIHAMVGGEPVEGRQACVLLIDDDRSLLLGLEAILKRAGYQALIAGNGDDGLFLAEQHCPDVIVCDVMMPPPNGLEVRRRLSRQPQLATIPFIFLTARLSQADKVYGIDLGADDYVTKPFDREELLARIRSVLRRAEISRRMGWQEAEGRLQELRLVISRVVGEKLRTPATRVLLAMDAVFNDKFGDDRGKRRAFVELALDNAYRLNALIEDLISLSDIDQGKLAGVRQALDLQRDVYAPIERGARRWTARRLNVSTEVDPALVLYAPAGGFQQALMHLVDNACKFSPEGGNVRIQLAAYEQGGCILTVSDQGAGIPPALREKVFERFFQAVAHDAQSGGLGVGLTIARAFARGLGGDAVILDSAEGCVVQLTIPPVSTGREI
jgi:two-component system sensor histidine kinase/response regulator